MQGDSHAELVAGRYRLGSPLGRGGMGDVYAGEDIRLGRPVAVKLLRWDWTERPGMRERFEAEARAAARLNHPNVVAVFDTGQHHGVPFIVMERLSGRTLASELRTGPLSQDRAVHITLQVLAALDAAHRQGVLHRDIKPANVLLTDAGDVKVADFGIAKLAEGSDATTVGLVLGTPTYLAPERLAGTPATPAGDTYSVGVLLHEMLVGAPPFRADDAVALQAALEASRPERVDRLRPDISPGVADVVTRAMATDPVRRYPTARAMASALDGADEPFGLPTRAVAAAADVTAVVATNPATSRRPVVEPTAVGHIPAAATRAPRSGMWAVIAAALLVAVLVVGVLLVAQGGDGDGSVTQVDGAETLPEPLRDAIEALDRAVDP